jgi:transcriptional regulator with XRE-family HTH domain
VSFGQWLLKELSAREIDQAELARRTKAGTSTVSRWVNDISTPTVENIVDIANALRLPAGTVFARVAELEHGGDEALIDLLAREIPPSIQPHEARLVIHLLRGIVDGIASWNREEDERDRLARDEGIRSIDAIEQSQQIPLYPVRGEPG